MIIRTEAIVLRAMEYGETSRIVTLFTQEKGKMAVLAKGARLLKSRFGSSLEPMSHSQVVFYFKQGRGLQTLRESALVQPLLGISRDLEKLALGQRVVELVYALMPEQEQHPQVFDILLHVLDRLDSAEEHAANLLPYFQLRLAMVLGFTPDIDRDLVEALPEEGGLLSLDHGAVLPLHAHRTGRRASRTALRAYAVFARANLGTIMRMRLEPSVRHEVHDLIEDFMRYHTEDAYPTRSDKVHGQLMQPTPPSPHRT